MLYKPKFFPFNEAVQFIAGRLAETDPVNYSDPAAAVKDAWKSCPS